jgi:eukaryotic translation initiation factor 2C
MRDVKSFMQTQSLHHWAVLSLDARCNEDSINKFVTLFQKIAKERSIRIDKPKRILFHRGKDLSNLEVSIKKAIQGIQNCQIIVCILSGPGIGYAEVKAICDTRLDLQSQCLQGKQVSRPNPQYCSNVLLKVNMKLGGINNTIVPNPTTSFFLDRPAAIFGADVTHAAPGSELPSIAAVVASMDRYATRYEVALSSQPSRKEIISELKMMARHLLLRFYQRTQKKPEKILFYRDGVGEGQFDQVIREELSALKAACASLEANYNPSITYVIVQKRHHIRFFAKNARARNDTDRSGNVVAGTVVDSVITTPNSFDFYLVSHGGIQGTSRPCHYHVVYDENRFSADLIQDLTHRLCYNYQRCARSVSLVPAAYFAHHAAARARCHMNKNQELEGMKQNIARSMFFI